MSPVQDNNVFEPLHDAHAIEQVAFAIQFDRPLNEVLFKTLLQTSQAYLDDLPSRIEIQNFGIAFGPANQVLPASNINENVGVAYRRVAPNGSTAAELRIERTAFTYRTTNYSRWADIWQSVKRYVDALAPIYLEQAQVASVSLNYVDKFIWDGNVADCNINSLLNPQSKYLCPHVFTADDFWHSHTGAFIKADNHTKRLLNLNVDYLDETNGVGDLRRVISIVTVMTDNLNQPGYDPIELNANNVNAFIDTHMQQMHQFGKVLLGDLLTQHMCQRIALTY